MEVCVVPDRAAVLADALEISQLTWIVFTLVDETLFGYLVFISHTIELLRGSYILRI